MKKILYLGRDGGVLFTDLPTAFNIVIRNRQSGNTESLCYVESLCYLYESLCLIEIFMLC